jgi:carnitine O-acetyltransferase
VIVYDNGRSGFLGEHSCMDGTTSLRMNEFVLASIARGNFDLNPTKTCTSTLPGVEELVFELDDKVQKAIKGSEARFDELVGKHDLEVMIQF